jgi:N-acyl-D-aspartate/D-glutamate deacylase
VATIGGTVLNKLFRADIRWQALAEPFLNYCDGVNTPLFEEFVTGVNAISATPDERRAMFRDPAYRAEFRKDWTITGARVFHRDLAQMHVVSSPDKSQVGKSFKQLADDAGAEPLEYFLDQLAEHDSALRWQTVVTNDRPKQRQYLFAHETTIPGFNDSGAHARNMAFQDGGLQMLQQVQANPGLMPLELAIGKLTGLSAQWLGLDTGTLEVGKRADVIVVDPAKLRTGLGPPVESYDERLHGAMRMVKRSDGVVRNVFIGGRQAFASGAFVPEFGRERFGKLLRSTR